MATLDVIDQVGGRPANFCDLGGGGDAQGVVDALEVITSDEQVKAILFNIFGGITRGDEVARGILTALEPDGDRPPDRRPPRRHERRGGPADAQGGRASEPLRRGDDALRGREGGARSSDGERLGRPRRGLPAERGAPRGPGPRPARRVGRGARTALDVASGGGHVARRLREAGLEVVTVDPLPGCARRRQAAPRTCRSPTAASTSPPAAWRRTTSPTSQPPCASWPASRPTACSSSTTSIMGEAAEEAERLRDPSHVRNYDEAEWRRLLDRGRPARSRTCASSSARSPSSRGSSVRAAGARTPSASASSWPTT